MNYSILSPVLYIYELLHLSLVLYIYELLYLKYGTLYL